MRYVPGVVNVWRMTLVNPGHRLRLRDETVVRVVHAESVIHVGAGDADLDQLPGADRGRCQLPRPLVPGRLDDGAGEV